MSYVYDPTTRLSQWMASMPLSADTHEILHGVYGSTYGPREEYEVLRQQNAYKDELLSNLTLELESLKQRETLRYPHSLYSPAGSRSHRVSGSETNNSTQHFPAPLGSLPGSPEPWVGERRPAVQGRRNEPSRSMSDRHHPRGERHVPLQYHDGLRSKEDLLAKLAAKPGYPASGYLIVARDTLRMQASEHSAPAGPIPSDEEILAEYLAALSSKDFVNALDARYRVDWNTERGHRFDHLDDNAIAAYVNVSDPAIHMQWRKQRIIGREQQFSLSNIWVVQVPFLHLEHDALEVMLPIDQEAIAGVNNDILRVLYVRLSNGSRTIPRTVIEASVEESRRRVLSELERRGFTEQLPRIARLCGLSDRSASRMSSGSNRLSKPKWTNIFDNQSSRWSEVDATGETRSSKDRRANEELQHIRRGSASVSSYVSGEVSEKQK